MKSGIHLRVLIPAPLYELTMLLGRHMPLTVGVGATWLMVGVIVVVVTEVDVVVVLIVLVVEKLNVVEASTGRTLNVVEMVLVVEDVTTGGVVVTVLVDFAVIVDV